MNAREASIARVLERELPEHLLLRTADASTITLRWDNSQTPAPLGSLVKPFLAIAYGEPHGFRYPDLLCNGCWLPQGHGRIGIVTALAHSCNTYFVQLARLTRIDDVERTAARYGLPMPQNTSPEALIGLFGAWRATPIAAAAAYNEFVARRTEPGLSSLYGAMRECARHGTASAAGVRVAAKTGTAPCVHREGRAAGDGLLIAAFPEEAPQFILMLRAHGTTGAECARRAGPCLREILK
jgi:cell division protein FtsI/penicillin-binding protein 2